MIQLEKIMLATDFSEYSDEAKRWACSFAERFGAELHVLHVIHDLASEVPDFGMGLAFPGYIENLPERKRQMEQNATDALARCLDSSWQQRNSVVLATRSGTPFVEIVQYARGNSIDLILLGTHGRSGLRHLLIGSVAERVVRKAGCPVLTIRPRVWNEETKAVEAATGVQPA